MADNQIVPVVTPFTAAMDEVTDAALGLVKVQYVKLMDGTLDGTAKAGVSTDGLSTTTEGKIAHDAVDSGKPVKIGGVARAAAPAAVAAGDRVDASFDVYGSQRTVITNSSGAALDFTSPVTVALNGVSAGEYETVAAGSTAQVLGTTGAAGNYLSHLLVTPATTSPGLVTVLDNAISMPVFVGGAASVSNLIPFVIPIAAFSASGAWKITTGANVSVLAVGDFT